MWLLLDYRAWLVAAIAGLGIYAAVQRAEKEHVKSQFAQFRADVESEAAKAKVAAARQEALQAKHAQEALDDLQTRLDRLNRAYAGLRDSKPSSRPVPRLSSAATVLSACPGVAGQPDPTIAALDGIEERVLAVLAEGDREIAKYVELYRLEQANAANRK